MAEYADVFVLLGASTKFTLCGHVCIRVLDAVAHMYVCFRAGGADSEGS